jgi:hypothetical protein
MISLGKRTVAVGGGANGVQEEGIDLLLLQQLGMPRVTLSDSVSCCDVHNDPLHVKVHLVLYSIDIADNGQASHVLA